MYRWRPRTGREVSLAVFTAQHLALCSFLQMCRGKKTTHKHVDQTFFYEVKLKRKQQRSTGGNTWILSPKIIMEKE